MALKLKEAGREPIGQFDGYDNNYLTLLGGEIGRWGAVPYTFPGSVDKASFDSFDGYCNNADQAPGQWRVAITSNLGTLVRGFSWRPLFLLDEGTSGYGVMLGTVVGGVVGQTSGTNLGPHTATGSGKVTLWDKPGLYGVTLDAVAPSINPLTSNPQVGDPLYAMHDGKLTLTAAEAFDFAITPTIVGRFAEFTTNGALVTTPQYLTAKFGAPQVRAFTELLFHFRIEN